VLLEKLQENEHLKYELHELQSRLDAANAIVTPSTEEIQPQRCLSSETTPHDVVNGRSESFVSVTSAASEIIDGTYYA